jgi:hypothetical protein
MPKVLHSLSLTFITILLSSCSPKTSENPSEVYQLWAGEKPSKNLKVLHGKYWQSGHFTKEYIMFMELRAPNDWIQEFIVQNKLKPATEPIALPSDAPLWFNLLQLTRFGNHQISVKVLLIMWTLQMDRS